MVKILHTVRLSEEDLQYLCEVLQPDINKGDSGALRLYWEFQWIIDPEKTEMAIGPRRICQT